jgi:poly(hydroxyalkanoate) depolymerase family esterase
MRKIVLVPLLALFLAVVPAGAAVPQTLDAVSDVAVVIANPNALESSSYVVSFTTGPHGDLKAGDAIGLVAPTGTDFLDSTGWTAWKETGEPVVVTRAAGSPDSNGFTNNTTTVTLGSPVAAGTRLAVRASWVTNPGPDQDLSLTVSTSAQPTPALSATYAIAGQGTVHWDTYYPEVSHGRCGGGGDSAECGKRGYMVYEPGGSSSSRPLVVDLHGCFTTAATEARWSRLHRAADEHDFVVLFPQQSPEANGGRCWNWFEDGNQHRDSPEPVFIAEVVQRIISNYDIDATRVYITGISAGGAMANIMLVTYPELFAAGVVYAGCEYKGLPCVGSAAAQPPAMSALAAAEEMGTRLRSVPVFVITGDLDAVVPMPNAEQVAQQWVAIDTIRRSGSPNVVPALPTESSTLLPEGRKPYTVDIWRDPEGCLLVQRWTVRGMGHAWAGAPSNGSPIDTTVTDAAAPDAAPAMIDFFFRHRNPGTADACSAV